MLDSVLLVTHDNELLSVRQFAQGAKQAASIEGITVIIDVFRASNTILALIDAGAIVTPVETIQEAMLFEKHVKVGEKHGRRYQLFDYDNSPIAIEKDSEKLRGKQVVIRTTNGTLGLLSALGSNEILMTSFRNLEATIQYCLTKYDENLPITFVAMGSKSKPRIEDIFCAKMCYFRILEKINPQDKTLTSPDNPWNTEWKEKIKQERFNNSYKIQDYEYALELNVSNHILRFDQHTFLINSIKNSK